MSRLRSLLVDCVATLSLFGAMFLVFWYDRHSLPRKAGPVNPPNVVTTVEEEPAPEPPPKPLRLAVTTCVDARNDPQYNEKQHLYDKMGQLLEQLGGGYRYTTITLTDLEDAGKIQLYDVIFLACSLHPRHWHDYSAPIRKGLRPGTENPQFDAKLMARLRANLHDFVERGGNLCLGLPVRGPVLALPGVLPGDQARGCGLRRAAVRGGQGQRGGAARDGSAPR